jgi:uncharacterized protein (TIGR00297 family)
MVRALAGALAATAIASFAERRGALSASGRRAAVLCGTVTTLAGWGWAGLLLAFFASSVFLTNWRHADRARRTVRSLPALSARNALQVFANGGVFAVLATVALVLAPGGSDGWTLGAAGALAAAAADTWSTEVGTVLGRTPRSILGGRIVAVGMSGGVTAAGLAAALAGAAFIGVIGAALLPSAPPALLAATTAGGFAGSLADSLAGAGLQSRRFCGRCAEWTERIVHSCGYNTEHRAGFFWVTNDVTNLLATLCGAGATVFAGAWLAR